MKAVLKVSKKAKRLIIIIGLLLIFSYLIRSTTLFWKTYNNEDAQVLFRYPIWWHLSKCKNYVGDVNYVDKIVFKKECFGVSGPSHGLIKVSKTENITNSVEYLKDNYGAFMGVVDFLEYQIGNRKGFTKQVQHIDKSYQLESLKVFYVITDEHIFEIDFENETDKKTINIILSSFQFY